MTISKFPPENPAVVMSDSQPSTKVDGTIWVDTDSDVPVVNPTDYVNNSLVANSKGALITSTGSAVAALTVGTNGHVLTADSAATNGIKWAAAASGADIDPLFLAGV